jgi:prepilin-type N-terminal cleavage/methylation domain-containing protein
MIQHIQQRFGRIPNQRRQRQQRGDTLVEVLVSVLIVSVILTGAYVTVNKSTVGVRNSQEHAEALKLAQSQLEQIRQDATKTSGSTVFTSAPSTFCMVNGASLSATLANECKQNAAGQTNTTTQPIYQLSDSRANCGSGLAANCFVFSVKVTWEDVTGHGPASEEIVYRLYQ